MKTNITILFFTGYLFFPFNTYAVTKNVTGQQLYTLASSSMLARECGSRRPIFSKKKYDAEVEQLYLDITRIKKINNNTKTQAKHIVIKTLEGRKLARKYYKTSNKLNGYYHQQGLDKFYNSHLKKQKEGYQSLPKIALREINALLKKERHLLKINSSTQVIFDGRAIYRACRLFWKTDKKTRAHALKGEYSRYGYKRPTYTPPVYSEKKYN